MFLLTLHRGGGTVLARVLNCHPDLVIWGEHVGLINRLAEIDDMVSRVGRLMAPNSSNSFAPRPGPRPGPSSPRRRASRRRPPGCPRRCRP